MLGSRAGSAFLSSFQTAIALRIGRDRILLRRAPFTFRSDPSLRRSIPGGGGGGIALALFNFLSYLLVFLRLFLFV